VIVVIMGVAGSGKSTIGELLAQRLGCPFLDADTLHPASNIAKMSRGEPLDDADRWHWLDCIGEQMARAAAQSEDRVVACSALADRYRERIRSHVTGLDWVFLHGSRELIAERLAHRQGHFMQASLLDSQFAVLEPPRSGEAFVVDITRPPSEVVAMICGWLKR
jgi:gluconokinase